MPSVHLGFLSIVEIDDDEYSGGLLVVNVSGRPVEFHCTAPAKPNRAQQILYGPTLRPYLFGEQIAPTLVHRVKSTLGWVATDEQDVLPAANLLDLPLVLLQPAQEDPDPHNAEDVPLRLSQREFAFRVDSAQSVSPHLSWRKPSHSRHPMFVAAQTSERVREIEERLQQHDFEGDLREPFERIHEAIEETLRTSR